MVLIPFHLIRVVTSCIHEFRAIPFIFLGGHHSKTPIFTHPSQVTIPVQMFINTKKYHVFAPMGRFQLESTAQTKQQTKIQNFKN